MSVQLDALRSSFATTNNRTRQILAHATQVHTVDWSCDGLKLASGSLDKTVAVFALADDRFQKEHTFRGHTDSVDQIGWHPKQPDVLATSSLDKTVRIWDTRDRNAVATITTKGENINLRWSPDGQTFAVGNKEDLVTWYDHRTHKSVNERQFRYEVNEFAWNNDGDLFFLTSGSGEIHIHSYPDMKHQLTMTGHSATCICIEFDSTGRHFAVGSADASVSIWDVDNIVCLRVVSRLEWPARTISFSHDGRLLAAGSEDLLIDVSHVDSAKQVVQVQTEGPTFTLAFHPKRYLLAYACDDKDKDFDRGSVRVFGFPSSI